MTKEKKKKKIEFFVWLEYEYSLTRLKPIMVTQAVGFV